MLISFTPDTDLADSEIAEEGVSILPKYYSARSKYTGIGTIEVETDSGVSLGKSRLELNVETGELRVADLVEADQMPADKEAPDPAAEELEDLE